MRNAKLGIILFILVCSCKSENKSGIDEQNKGKTESNQNSEISKYESKLLDLRAINQQFTPELKLNKFGILKNKDNTTSFVFKLDPSTEANVVKSFSYGVRGFYFESSEPYKASHSPQMKTIKGEKYIILKNKLKNIKYLDSLYVFVYERNNWKESGKLGDIKIKDILIED